MTYKQKAEELKRNINNPKFTQLCREESKALKAKIEAEGVGCDEWTGTTEDGSMFGKTNYCDEMVVLCSKCLDKQEAIKMLDEALR